MGKFFGSAVGWIITLLVAIIVLLAGILLGWFGGGGEPGPDPSGTASPTSSSPTPSAFVERPVTTGTYVPAAAALTAEVLAAAGSGWFVAIDDTTQVNMGIDPHTVTPDQKILYLISPDGARYELANLDAIGLTSPNLVAWDDARNLLLLEQAGTTLNVVDMETGAVASSWTFCASGYGTARYGQARAGNWLVRGGCEGEGLDAVYTDTGAVVPSNTVGQGPFFTVTDVGPVQVRHEFERGPDERFVAFYPDGTSAAIPTSSAGDCYPLGKGRGATVAIYCYSDTGDLSIWELPADGSAPYPVVSAMQLEDYAAVNGGFGPGDFWVTDYCSDSVLGIIQFSLADLPKLGVLYGGSVEAVGESSYPYRTCHAVSGTSALVSGGGALWWADFDSGASVSLLPGMGSGSPIQTVGTDGYMIGIEGYTALRQP